MIDCKSCFLKEIYVYIIIKIFVKIVRIFFITDIIFFVTA